MENKEIFSCSIKNHYLLLEFRWMIPINICTGKSPDNVAMTVLMSDPDMLIYVDNATPEDWIKASH